VTAQDETHTSQGEYQRKQTDTAVARLTGSNPVPKKWRARGKQEAHQETRSLRSLPAPGINNRRKYVVIAVRRPSEWNTAVKTR